MLNKKYLLVFIIIIPIIIYLVYSNTNTDIIDFNTYNTSKTINESTINNTKSNITKIRVIEIADYNEDRDGYNTKYDNKLTIQNDKNALLSNTFQYKFVNQFYNNIAKDIQFLDKTKSTENTPKPNQMYNYFINKNLTNIDIINYTDNNEIFFIKNNILYTTDYQSNKNKSFIIKPVQFHNVYHDEKPVIFFEPIYDKHFLFIDTKNTKYKLEGHDNITHNAGNFSDVTLLAQGNRIHFHSIFPYDNNLIFYKIPNNIHLIEQTFNEKTSRTVFNDMFFMENIFDWLTVDYHSNLYKMIYNDTNLNTELIIKTLESDLNYFEEEYPKNRIMEKNVRELIKTYKTLPLFTDQYTTIHELDTEDLNNRITKTKQLDGLIYSESDISKYNDFLYVVTTKKTDTPIDASVMNEEEYKFKSHRYISDVYTLDKNLNVISKLENIRNSSIYAKSIFLNNTLHLVDHKNTIIIKFDNDYLPRVLNTVESQLHDIIYEYNNNYIISSNVGIYDSTYIKNNQTGTMIRLIDISNNDKPTIKHSIMLNDTYNESTILRQNSLLSVNDKYDIISVPFHTRVNNYCIQDHDVLLYIYDWNGFYVYNITDKEFKLQDMIFHTSDNTNLSSFFLNDKLYTFSNNHVKMYDINTKEITNVKSINEKPSIDPYNIIKEIC